MAQVDAALLATVTDPQLAALVERRQPYDEGREHAVDLLGVAVGDEEAALVVDEQLIERSPSAGSAERSRDLGHDRLERGWPGGVADADRLRADLPGSADAGVDERVPASPIGRDLGDRHELLRLRR